MFYLVPFKSFYSKISRTSLTPLVHKLELQIKHTFQIKLNFIKALSLVFMNVSSFKFHQKFTHFCNLRNRKRIKVMCLNTVTVLLRDYIWTKLNHWLYHRYQSNTHNQDFVNSYKSYFIQSNL